MYQENNLDIAGQMLWAMAPLFDMSKRDLPPFGVIESGKFNARSKFYSRREGSDGYLLLYTQSGKGLLIYNSRTFELLSGDIVLIDCRRLHEYRTFDDADGDWAFYWIYFYGEHANFFMQMIYRDFFSALNLDDTQLSLSVFENIIKNLQYTDAESLMLLNDSVYKILMCMIESAKIEKKIRSKESATKTMLKEAAEYIKINHWQSLVLEDIAKNFGLSKFHFLRLFKEFTGMTPYRYMIIERINAAKKLLQTSEMKISEISLMVGFADESNFIRTFKSVSGVTPQAYRLNK